MEVTLQQILDAREHRASRQQALLQEYGKPLICFTMNIAGPTKNSALITHGFHLGNRLLHAQLSGSGISLLHKERYEEAAGCEGYYVADADSTELKKLAVQIEDNLPVGRLFDMDVIAPDGSKVSRERLDLPGRKCLLCNNPVYICSRSRAHSVEALQEKTRELLQNALWQQDAQHIGVLAVKSLLYEVCTTPKPGLVDRRNNGSHKDMDIFTFLSSSAALQPYFTGCALTGLQTAQADARETFEKIRFLGKQAEQAMLQATNGVNTHKGAIFTLGLLCAAVGRLDAAQRTPEAICAQAAAMTAGLTEADMKKAVAQTTGEKLYAQYGITGVRGQAEAGFPALLRAGLPTLKEGLRQGLSLEEAGCAALLKLMCAVTDTNLIARSDLVTQQQVCQEVESLLKETPFPGEETLVKLDNAFIEKKLSPGGSADLLAATYFLYSCKKDL